MAALAGPCVLCLEHAEIHSTDGEGRQRYDCPDCGSYKHDLVTGEITWIDENAPPQGGASA